MRVNPISAKQAEEQSAGFEPWKAGDYDFNVYDASEEVSTEGNEMIKLTLHVLNPEGQRRTVFDYLVNTEKGQWKVRHCAEAIGMLPQYERGEMETIDIVGRMGRLKLRLKPASGQYPARNSVGDYIPLPAAHQTPVVARPSAARVKAPAGDIDDDIPF